MSHLGAKNSHPIEEMYWFPERGNLEMERGMNGGKGDEWSLIEPSGVLVVGCSMGSVLCRCWGDDWSILVGSGGAT